MPEVNPPSSAPERTWNPVWIYFLLFLPLALVPLEFRLPALAGWLAAGVWLLRPLAAELVGPVYVFDLVRNLRSGHFVFQRAAYGFTLLFLLYFLMAEWQQVDLSDWRSLFQPGQMDPDSLPRFAEAFVVRFLVFQLLAVLVVTPAVTAPAIVEEREQGVLDFLLITDLRSQEIVIGKLASRLTNLVFLILTGLPVVILMVLLGGVDAGQIVMAYLYTFLLLLTVASVSMAASVVSASSTSAVHGAYLLCTPILFCCGIMPWAVAGQQLSGVALILVGGGLVFISAVCLRRTVELVRSASDEGRPRPRLQTASRKEPVSSRPAWVPPVGDQPVLWRECHLEPAVRLAEVPESLRMLSVGGLVVAVVLFATNITAIVRGNLLDQFSWPGLGREMNGLLMAALPALATAGMLAIALSAAGAVSREIERNTLEPLLASLQRPQEILLGKLAGALYGNRMLGWGLAGLVFMGLLTGGLHPLAMPLAILSASVFAGFFGCLGLYVSALAGSTLRAILTTLVIFILVLTIPYFAGERIGALVSLLGGPDDLAQWLGRFVKYGLSPPAALAMLIFPMGEDQATRHLWPALAGTAFYALLAVLLWQLNPLGGFLPDRRPEMRRAIREDAEDEASVPAQSLVRAE